MRRVSGFTLVELLVVIAIMIIIMGFSVPMFSKISFGNAVDGASRMISSQLSLARAEAVAKRQYIAIIMPGPSVTSTSGGGATRFEVAGNDDEYNFKAFRAAIVQATSDSNVFTFDSWFPGTEWGFLPTGAVLAEADDDGVDTSSNSISDCECRESYSGTPLVLDSRVVKADWLNSSNELTGDHANTSTAGMTIVNGVDGYDGVRAIVFKPNGRVAGSGNMFVTIVEGVPVAGSGGNYILTNGSTGNNNMRLIKIDQYTGKLKFLAVNYP